MDGTGTAARERGVHAKLWSEGDVMLATRKAARLARHRRRQRGPASSRWRGRERPASSSQVTQALDDRPCEKTDADDGDAPDPKAIGCGSALFVVIWLGAWIVGLMVTMQRRDKLRIIKPMIWDRSARATLTCQKLASWERYGRALAMMAGGRYWPRPG